MNKVLITGINGFLGKHVSQYFTNMGFDVYGTVKSKTNIKENNRIFKLNVKDHTVCKSLIKEILPDIIIHLAGVSTSQNENHIETYSVNVAGTNNLLLAISMVMREQNDYLPSSIVIPSSSFVYDNENSVPYSEEMKLNAVGHYGISKIMKEQVANSFKNYLPIIIVRSFNIIGPEQSSKFFVGKLTENFHNRSNLLELGNLNIERDFMDVRDFCRQLHKLLKLKAQGIFNFCSGRPTRLNYILDAFIEVTGHKPEVIFNKELFRKIDTPIIFGQNDKLIKKTNDFEFKKIIETVSWIMSYNNYYSD